MMETDVLGYKSPLYGRRTGQIKLSKLSFENFTKFFPNSSLEEIIKFYGSVDGIPFYIKEFDPRKNFIENIKNTFWQSKSILSVEAEFLLKEELRGVEKYLSVMRSIFEGSTKLNEIATKSRIDITNINKYLTTLINLGFVRKEYPVIVNRPKRKNFIYRIGDNYFRFWLSYVYPFQSDIEIGEITGLSEFFRKDYPSYMGHVFEGICADFLGTMREKIFNFTKAGRWWYKDNEIDIVCLDETKREALFVECKWSGLTENQARKILEELKEKSKFVDWERKKEYFGLIGKKINGKDRLRKEGYFVWDLEDLKKYK